MKTPLDQLALIHKPPTRIGKIDRSKPTKATHYFLFKKGKICEVTGSMLTTPESKYTQRPMLKSNQELWEILYITNLHFLRKAEIISQLKKLYKNLIEHHDFSKKEDPESLPSMFKKV